MKAQVALMTLLAVGILLGSGCTTAVINPGGEDAATYRFGKLTAAVPASISNTYQATEKAMQQLGLNVVQKLQDQLEGEVVARDAQDKKVVVKLLSTTEQSTKLTIGAGSLTRARRIYDMILENLQEG